MILMKDLAVKSAVFEFLSASNLHTRMKGTTITSSISNIYFCGSASNKSLMEQSLFLSIAR